MKLDPVQQAFVSCAFGILITCRNSQVSIVVPDNHPIKTQLFQIMTIHCIASAWCCKTREKTNDVKRLVFEIQKGK